MARRPSIQLDDLQNSFSKSIDQQSYFVIQAQPSTKSIKKSSQKKRQSTYFKQTNTLIEDYCIIKNEEPSPLYDKQKTVDYLRASKLDQLRYRIASAQKTKVDQNKKLVKTISIPLNLQKNPPMIRIHHQGLVKNCQKVQLQYRHFFNQMTKAKSVKTRVDVKRALTVCSSNIKSKNNAQSKKQTKVSNLNLQKNKRSHSEPPKIAKEQLTEENQFLPKTQLQKIEPSYKNMLKSKAFQSRIQLKMIKFDPFRQHERKNALNKDNIHYQQTQNIQGNEKLYDNLHKDYKNICNSFSSKSNQQGLSLELLQLHKRIKDYPARTPKDQMALFKNKLQGKGNHRLIL